MAWAWRRETAIAAAAAAVIASFGAGFGVAKIGSPHAAPSAQATNDGFQWPFFGKPRDAKAPRALPKKPDGFGVWTTRLDTSRADPQACIRMSRDLDPRRSYGDFVSVSPDLGHPAAVSVNGDELCVSGVGYEARKITLLHGLPARSGEVLDADAEVAFDGGEKQPYVGFAGTGVILPREDADGIGLETVNVSKLHIELWRVPDRNLVRKEISAPDPQPEGGYEYDGGNDAVGDDGRKVWEGDLLVHGKPDDRTTTVFPFGAALKTLEPGAYVIKAKDASGLKGEGGKAGEGEGTNPASARRWVLFTDMALQAYHGSDGLDVTVRSLKTAHAMGGVRVALVGKDGKDLASASSDGDGRVRFDRALLAGEQGAAPAQVMAYGPKADFVAMDLSRAPVDLSKQDIGGRTPPGGDAKFGAEAKGGGAVVDGFVYADRGVYRPGETVHLTALLRDRLARAVKDRPGAVVIRRPSGLEFQRIRFVATPNGAAAQDLVLPRSSPRGRWRATMEMDGSDDPSGETSFQVEDFAPQRLAVTLAAAADRPVLGGEQRAIGVDSKFLYGAVAAGLPVQAEARIIADPDPFPAFDGYAWGDQQTPFAEKMAPSDATTTDGAGHATETLDASAVQGATQPLLANFSASVFEPGGRPVAEAAKLRLRMKPLYLGVKTTATGTGDKPVQTFEIIAVDPFGRRTAVSGVNYLLVAEKWDYEWYESGGRWSWKRTNRDIPIAKGQLAIGAGAAARISRALPWGDYRLILEDPATGAKTVIRQASGWGEPTDGVEAPDTARVSPVKANYRTGDTVQVRVEAPFAGEAQVAVATDRLLALKSVSVPAGGATISLKADASWAGGAYVLVSVVQPRDPVASPKPRRALGVAYVPLETPGRKLTVAVNAPPKIDSKAAVSVPLQVKGLKLGQRAHVTLAAVDEGILRLTHQANPDPVSWYFGKRALTLDYRDDYGRLLDPNLGAAAAVNFGADEMGGAGLTATPIKTVALWSGVVDTGIDGRATIKLPAAPEFNGQLRLVAVAWTDEAVGSGVNDVIVREPLVAELSLPRFLAPGDHAFATVELHNVEARVGQYLAELFGRNGILAPFRNLYQLALGQRVVERTEIVGAPNPGVGRVDFHVSGPGFATQKSYPLETRLGWGPTTRATTALQRPGESFTPTPDLLSGLSPGGGLSMTVSYSPFRGFDPAPIADSLSRYPYGCSEQLVSAAYPLLYAPEVGTDPKLKRVSPQIAGAISKLLDREALDGSFGLWRVGDGEADPWLGAYITDFLLEARARGAAVPDDAIARALDGMRMISRPEGFGSIGYHMSDEARGKDDAKAAEARTERLRSRAAAYALYVMAKAKRGDLPRLRWFHDVGFATEPSPLARAQVGAALAAMGDRGRAHDSFVKAVAALNFKEPDDLYQSPLRDLAGVIAYAYEAGEAGIARSLQGRLEQTVKSPDDLNTQEQAHLLRAAHVMLAAAGPIRINATGAGALGGSRWAVGRLADAHFANAGGPIWRTVTVHGLPTASPPAANAGLSVEKAFFAMNGARLDPAALKQGDRVVIRLAGGLREARSRQVVLDDALPAGFEIETTLAPEDGVGAKDSDGKETRGAFAFLGQITSAQVQEKRDDRYIASLTTGGGRGYVLAYVARAVTPGDFYLPGAEARDMYRPTVRGRTAAARTRIAAGS